MTILMALNSLFFHTTNGNMFFSCYQLDYGLDTSLLCGMNMDSAPVQNGLSPLGGDNSPVQCMTPVTIVTNNSTSTSFAATASEVVGHLYRNLNNQSVRIQITPQYLLQGSNDVFRSWFIFWFDLNENYIRYTVYAPGPRF